MAPASLHIVKNYTGDVMNFDMAAEMGQGEDIEVETVAHQRRRGGGGLASTRLAGAASA